jgi:hypothetical protein
MYAKRAATATTTRNSTIQSVSTISLVLSDHFTHTKPPTTGTFKVVIRHKTHRAALALDFLLQGLHRFSFL